MTLGMLGAVGHIAMSVSIAHATWMLYLARTLGLPSFLVLTAAQAIMSKLVLKDEQGKLFALLAATQHVMPLFSSVIFTAIFAATVDYWPGFYSLVAACSGVIPLVLLVLAAYFMRRDARHMTKEFAPDVSSSNLADLSEANVSAKQHSNSNIKM